MELKISTGEKEFNINGKYTVRFNPTDINFARRLFAEYSVLEAKQKEYRARVDKAKGEELLDLVAGFESETRKEIDNLLGEGLCDAAFGSVSIHALSDGLPIWLTLILAIIDEMDADVLRQEKLQKEKIRKYTAKYEKRYHR